MGPYLNLTHGVFLDYSTMEVLGGRVVITDGVESYEIQGGNPPVYLPFESPLLTMIDLPSIENFGSTPAVVKPIGYWRPTFWFGETLYLQSDIAASKCNDVDIGDASNIVGTLSGTNTKVRYGRYVELDENTLETPIPNGGGDLVDVEGVCSNVFMSWENSEYTTLHCVFVDIMVHLREVLILIFIRLIHVTMQSILALFLLRQMLAAPTILKCLKMATKLLYAVHQMKLLMTLLVVTCSSWHLVSSLNTHDVLFDFFILNSVSFGIHQQ